MEVPIRVVARVKPPPPNENEETCLQVAPTASQIVFGFNKFYDFDAVFGENVSQKELYSTCLADMVSSFFQGFNTTVVSYGQHSSGKSYTMTGPDFLWAMNEGEFGLLPQAVRHIFKMMNEVPDREYRVHISYLIIHQESVYDLLSSGHPLSPLNVLEDNGGNVVIPGLTVIDCSNISEVLNCLEAGLLQRHSASTQGFDLSSAHTMFNLTLEHQWAEPDGRLNYLFSRISFVDLAGTEGSMTLDYSDIGGITNSLKNNLLNSDLKALTNVLYCLANKNHRGMLPYKHSRLTHILKDSFGGNSLTLMVCCLSPSTKDCDASLNTLKLGCLTRYVINFPVLNLVLQNSMQSITSPLSTLNIPNGCSSHPSTYTGNLSSTQLSIGTTIRSASTPQQYLVNGGPIMPQHLSVPAPLSNSFVGFSEGLPTEENEEIFKVQFAASQWHLLVSSAEDLLAEILQTGTISPAEKSRIQSWLCMKAEADECIGTDLPPLQTQPGASRPLEVIEELSEPNDQNETSSMSNHSLESESEISSSVSSLGEEFYDQLETLKEKFISLTTDLIRNAENQYDSCNKLWEELSQKKILEAKEEESEVLKSKMTTSCEDMKSKVETMSISNSSTSLEELRETRDDVYEKDKDNLNSNYGSRLSLLSKTSLSPPILRRSHKSPKASKRMYDKFKKMSSRGKPHSNISVESASSTDPNTSNGELLLNSADNEELGESSENELLKKMSSKFVSVSKGSSKCVNSLRTKSCQLKRSIRSHIFKKRNKTSQISIDSVVEPCKISHSSDLRPCSVRRVSDELRVAQERLQELKATIKVKEAFILELKMSGNEAETTRKKCSFQIKQLEEELKDIRQLYYKAQNKMIEASGNEDEKNHYRNKVDGYRHEMNHLQKKLASLQKVAAISQQNDPKVKELEESIRELREQQQELHTKLREEMQRKQQLEHQIIRDERCARNPLCSSQIIDEDSDRDVDIDAEKQLPVLASDEKESNSCDMDKERKKYFHSKKRKLVNSTGDSQSETNSSWRCDTRMSHRERSRKAGRIEINKDEELEEDESTKQSETLRKEIGLLRVARDGLVVKRQRIDRRIRKGRTKGDGCEDERRLLELDEAVEGMDSVIERKNELLSGKIDKIEPFSTFLSKHDLEDRLRCLPLDELHFLLIKFFNRIIDLRIEFRRQELAFAELENQYDEQCRYISNLKAAYQQASLEMERRLTSLQRDYQYKISYLLRQFNDDSSGYGVHEMKVLEMEQQLYYYKKLSRELKDKLKEYLNQGQSRLPRELESVPGPSGIKDGRLNLDPSSAFCAQRPQRPSLPSPALPEWPRRGRRFAMHSGNSQTTKVTREKNKIIIQQKGDKHNA